MDTGTAPVEASAQGAALRLRPDRDLAAGNLAWPLATAPDSALRDPQRAIELAEGVAQTRSFRDCL